MFTGKLNYNWKGGKKYKHVCVNCGKVFKDYSYRARIKKITCSPKCKYIVQGKNLSSSNSPWWKGGKISTSGGYVLIYKPEHPFAQKKGRGYVLEHRLVMEQHLGRFLGKNEVVHHKNGNRSDNLIENLVLMEKGQHIIHHHKGKKLSQKHKKHLSDIRKGTKMPIATRKKIAKTMRKVRKERFWSSTLT